MSEYIPLYVDLELDPQLFTETVTSVGMLMSQRGAHPWTLRDDSYARGNLDGMEDLPGITDDTVVGRLTTITGQSQGVSYGLDFLMYNEIAGARSHNRVPMIDMRVTATVGDELEPEAGSTIYHDHRYGELRGLIWLYADRTTTADFGHGTTASSDPELQKFLEKLVSYYGVDAEDLFAEDAPLSFAYDEERLKRLASGIQALMTSEL